MIKHKPHRGGPSKQQRRAHRRNELQRRARNRLKCRGVYHGVSFYVSQHAR